jgi:hypothetical protein
MVRLLTPTVYRARSESVHSPLSVRENTQENLVTAEHVESPSRVRPCRSSMARIDRVSCRSVFKWTICLKFLRRSNNSLEGSESEVRCFVRSIPLKQLPSGSAGFSQCCQVVTGLIMTLLVLGAVGTAVAVSMTIIAKQSTRNSESTSTRGLSLVLCSKFNDELFSFSATASLTFNTTCTYD